MDVRYCRNCYRVLESDNIDFCSDTCEEEFLKHSINNKEKCSRCGKASGSLKKFNIETNKDILLCETCTEKYVSQLNSFTNEFVGLDNFELAAKHIIMGLHDLGFDTDIDNFKDTPKRFARAYSEIFSGCKDTDSQVKSILATSFPSAGSENMVIAKDIVCFSMCPHHLLPVEYRVCVGYIPDKDGNVLGISKLARLVTILAKRPALQETFTQDICDYLDTIGGKGSIALVEGQHMCMRMRGAKAVNTSITTTSVTGYFKESDTTKQEFLKNISDRLRFKV